MIIDHPKYCLASFLYWIVLLTNDGAHHWMLSYCFFRAGNGFGWMFDAVIEKLREGRGLFVVADIAQTEQYGWCFFG